MDLERKGRQSYQGLLYVRFLAFGNGTMKSLYDRSNGFYRRQLILSVRERDPNRRDDPLPLRKAPKRDRRDFPLVPGRSAPPDSQSIPLHHQHAVCALSE